MEKMNFQTEPNSEQHQMRNLNMIYDEKFVKYINSLCDAIKQFCKVTKNNIKESFKSLNSSKYVTNQITTILNQIMNMNKNTNYQENLNELFKNIYLLNYSFQSFEKNLNSDSESVTIFFNDAKFLVKQIKELRNKNLSEMSFNKINKIISPYKTNNDNKQLNNIYNDILETIKNFGNNLIYSTDIKKQYNEMVNNIKNKLDKFTSISDNIKISINGENSLINQLNKTDNIYNRSKSPIQINKLKYNFEKINQNNISYELQINELQKQIITFKQKIQFLEYKLKISTENNYINNNLNKIKNSPFNISKTDNNKNIPYSSSTRIHLNNNINPQILLKKDNEIMLYKNKLNFFQKKINILMTELNKLNSINNDTTINKFQKEIQLKNNQILKLNNQIKMIENDRNKLKIELQSYINGSPNNNSLQNKNEIQELNNQIMNLSKIIEEKDNIINQQNNLNMGNFDEINISQLIQENNNLKEELLKYTDNKNIGIDYDTLIKENKEYKKQFEELQDKFIKTKIFYDENLNNLQNNFKNKDLINELMEYKKSLLNTELEKNKLIKELNEIKNNNEFNISNNINDKNELIKKINELSLNNKIIQDSKNNLENDIKKKNEELEGLKIFIQKLQNEREKFDSIHLNDISNLSKNDKKNGIPFEKYANLINKLNDTEKQIEMLQKSNIDLQNKLKEKNAEKINVYRSEDLSFTDYEEEFDLKKMIIGARDKNRSEDVNIDYPAILGIKEKQTELLQKLNMLEVQVRILLYNINCNGKIKPTVIQICQLLGLDDQKIQMVISGKGKKTVLGIIN